MTYVFCDVEGTYNVLDRSDKFELIELLSKLDDKVFFSFLSSANLDYIKGFYEEMLDLTKNTNITLLSQIGYDEYYNEIGEAKKVLCGLSKALKMIYFQNSTELSGDKINHVIYIDDNANMYPLIYTMDNEFNNRLKNNDLKFTIIEKDKRSFNYCHDSIDVDNVLFISNDNKKFMIDGLKELSK